MAKRKTTGQPFPRINDPDNRFDGCLDESQLIPHTKKIPVERMKEITRTAIETANTKSSPTILSFTQDTPKEIVEDICRKEGEKLFSYFKKYCSDPALAAIKFEQRPCKAVCEELFRIRTMQKERMNAGWRYQYLAKACALESGRFESVSDIGTEEADFHAVIRFQEAKKEPLSLYVSVKNRVNTMGGQDWPKAIHALEDVAKYDKNRTGPYCCVFGIAMERGYQSIKSKQKTNQPHSPNTEIWKSDFFWPFFANYSFGEIMTFAMEILKSMDVLKAEAEVDMPDPLIESFCQKCRKASLLTDADCFVESTELVKFFCR